VTGTALWAIALAIWFILLRPPMPGLGVEPWRRCRRIGLACHARFLMLAALGFLAASVVSETSAAHSIRRYPAEVNAA